MEVVQDIFPPSLQASTGNLFNKVLDNSDGSRIQETASSNHFRSAQWTPDGSTILTSSADQVLRTFILSADLLSSEEHALTPYSSCHLPSPAYATAIYPGFNLSEPSTALYLISLASLPLRLVSPFSSDLVASYPLINPTTEAYIAPHSLLFDSQNAHGSAFFAGSESEISIFDISRNGEGPVTRMKSIPSRRNRMVDGGVGMKGIVSSLALGNDVLAAGTFTRWIGLYDSSGRGGTVGVFSLQRPTNEHGPEEGAGITQVLWASQARYLCVAERGSTGVSVWDIRHTGTRVQWLAGRKAETMQRIGVEVIGDSLWGGGIDGFVQRWDGLGKTEGVVHPTFQFKAHDDAVPSATVHPSEHTAIMATCSGQRHEDLKAVPGLDEAVPELDNSLKIWSFEVVEHFEARSSEATELHQT